MSGYEVVNTVIRHESWLQQLDYRITELEKKHVGFAREIPEPEVARSQQWLADRLSEAENSKDERWLGEKNFDKLTGSWGHKDPDGDDDVRGLA